MNVFARSVNHYMHAPVRDGYHSGYADYYCYFYATPTLSQWYPASI